MNYCTIILSKSDAPPWVAIIWVIVFVVIVVARLVGSISRKTQAAAPKPPPGPPIPPSLFAGVQAGRLVAPPPPPRLRRPRRLADLRPPPPPPRPAPPAAAKTPDSSEFPEARASVSGALSVGRTAGNPLPGSSSILAELRSPAAIRSAIILTELLERPAVLRDEPGGPD